MYDRATRFWSLLLSVLEAMPFNGHGRDVRKGLFWSAHQRFFKGLLIASKVQDAGGLLCWGWRRAGWAVLMCGMQGHRCAGGGPELAGLCLYVGGRAQG